MTDPLAPGQVWQHTGFDDVQATGLQVRVLRRAATHRYEGEGWVCDYPQRPGDGERWYPRGPWKGWEIIGGKDHGWLAERATDSTEAAAEEGLPPSSPLRELHRASSRSLRGAQTKPKTNRSGGGGHG